VLAAILALGSFLFIRNKEIEYSKEWLKG
jgi:hypothetical protein